MNIIDMFRCWMPTLKGLGRREHQVQEEHFKEQVIRVSGQPGTKMSNPDVPPPGLQVGQRYNASDYRLTAGRYSE